MPKHLLMKHAFRVFMFPRDKTRSWVAPSRGEELPQENVVEMGGREVQGSHGPPQPNPVPSRLRSHLLACCSYGAEAGQAPLRELIATKMYPGGQVKASEVFVSDGSKCDIGRLQMMFGKGISVAVQV